jgi:fermentation-respiration switch protein FrsA (DUF1100 family)
VGFQSRDGLALHGWWIPAESAVGTIIQCHGNNGSMDADLPTAKLLHSAGFNVLMFNFRAHGQSEGNTVTFGWFETLDLLGAIDYVVETHGARQVGVMGFSMGAAVAIRAAGFSQHIACIVADGATARLETTLVAWLKERHVPPRLASWISHITLWMGALRTGAPLHQIDASQWITQLRNCPVFFIHGAEDALVPLSEIKRLVANAPVSAQLWVASGCGHREALDRYRDQYTQHVVAWFTGHLL